MFLISCIYLLQFVKDYIYLCNIFIRSNSPIYNH